jgi:hypothetical protein
MTPIEWGIAVLFAIGVLFFVLRLLRKVVSVALPVVLLACTVLAIVAVVYVVRTLLAGGRLPFL